MPGPLESVFLLALGQGVEARENQWRGLGDLNLPGCSRVVGEATAFARVAGRNGCQDIGAHVGGLDEVVGFGFVGHNQRIEATRLEEGFVHIVEVLV